VADEGRSVGGMNACTRHWSAVAILGGCAVATGASFVLFKASVLVQEPMVPGESTWFIAAQNLVPRFLIGVLLLVALEGGRVLRLTRVEWTQAIFMAVTSFTGCLLQTDGLQRTSAATTAFLTQFYVILIPLWWAVLQRKRPGAIVLLAAGLVLGGVAVLARVDWQTLRLGRGELEVLLAAVSFSLLLCSLNWPAFAGNRSERTSAAMFLIETGLFAAVSVVTGREAGHVLAPYFSWTWLWLALVTTLLGTAGPFILMNRWQRFVTPAEAGLLYSFTPVIAVLTEIALPAPLARWTGITYPNQPLTQTLVVGGALILLANALIQVKSRTGAGVNPTTATAGPG
jgi:drug/metabolite transporter (DMT)-like permease